MDSNEFEVLGKSYKLGKINALKQFHIVRRLGPVLSDMLPAITKVARDKAAMDNLSEEDKLARFAEIGAPLMSGIAKLSDSDANLVLYGLLSCVEVKQEPVGNWARVATADALMFSDMDLPVMLNLAGRAFVHNLGGFFAALPSTK